MRLSDSELLNRLAAGDPKAFKSLFTAYFPKLKVFIFSILRDAAEAENLSQDIFVKLWQSRETIGGIRNINAYIYRMAKNAAFDHLAKTAVNPGSGILADDLGGAVAYEEITDELIARELDDIIRLTVRSMPPQQRNIFIMSREEGLSNDEIAVRLDISKRTVEKHISSALARLRKSIKAFHLFF